MTYPDQQNGHRSALRALILDMDGVLWRGLQPIGDLPAIFELIARRGWRVVLATNNATRTAQQHLDKLASFGVQLEPWQAINSAQAAALFLRERFPNGGPVYAIGEDGIQVALHEQGFFLTDRSVLAVVVGLDRGFTYEKLSRAATLVREGALFVGTNPDVTLPTPQGFDPGAGSLLAAVAAASGVQPVITGKPQPYMYQAALKRLQTSPAETLVVGDRLETDIAGGQALGCRTALVLSGVNSEADARQWSPAPDLVAADLAAVLEQLVLGDVNNFTV